MAFKMKGFSGFRKSSPKKSRSAFKQDPPPNSNDYTSDQILAAKHSRFKPHQEYYTEDAGSWADKEEPFGYDKDWKMGSYDPEGNPIQFADDPLVLDKGNLRLIRQMAKDPSYDDATRAFYKELAVEGLNAIDTTGGPLTLDWKYSKNNPDRVWGMRQRRRSQDTGNLKFTGDFDARSIPKQALIDIHKQMRLAREGQSYRMPVPTTLDKVGPNEIPSDKQTTNIQRGPGLRGNVTPEFDPMGNVEGEFPGMEFPVNLEKIPSPQLPGKRDLNLPPRRELEGNVEAEFPEISFEDLGPDGGIPWNQAPRVGSDARKEFYDKHNLKYDDTIKGYNRDGTKKEAITRNTSAKDRASLIAALKNAPFGSKLREQIFTDLGWTQDHTTTGYRGPGQSDSQWGKMDEVRGVESTTPSESKKLMEESLTPKSTTKPKQKPKPKPKPKPTVKKGGQYTSIVERGKAAQEKRKKAKKGTRKTNLDISDLGARTKERLDDIFGGV